MKQKRIFKLLCYMAMLTCVGCNNNTNQSVNTNYVTQNEYKETNDILNYKYGITDSIRKRMFLSELAFHYALEYDDLIDSSAPIIYVSYEKKYKGFDVYSISRSDPWSLDVMEVTELELMGRYIVAYSIPGGDTLSMDEIIQMGINSESGEYITVHESSWFVFLSSDMRKYIIVKDFFSTEEACRELNAFLKDSLSHNPEH
ncbi:MAG: hypothetical protein IKJ67_04905 [Bacteroidales bacterium]|nr:hypothetical protein [Bacteroidales bacterium]